jgi:hypothetical protein
MRFLLAASLINRLCLGATAFVYVAGLMVAAAQPVQFGIGRPSSVQLSAPRVDVISGATATRLEQARTLAKEGNWDDAVDILRELAGERSDKVVDLGDGRYVSLQAACHLEVAHLPADGLTAYRRRVDPLAERWFREGVSGRDETMLRRVVNELFCSSWGDDALMALGELVLERGDYAAARRFWEQMSPLLRDPAGQPMWNALRDIDLTQYWPQVERRWLERPKPPTWLAYPDTQFELSEVGGVSPFSPGFNRTSCRSGWPVHRCFGTTHVECPRVAGNISGRRLEDFCRFAYSIFRGWKIRAPYRSSLAAADFANAPQDCARTIGRGIQSPEKFVRQFGRSGRP